MKIALLSLLLCIGSSVFGKEHRFLLNEPRSWYWDDWAKVIPSPNFKNVLFEQETIVLARQISGSEIKNLTRDLGFNRLFEGTWLGPDHIEVRIRNNDGLVERQKCNAEFSVCELSRFPAGAQLLSVAIGRASYWRDGSIYTIELKDFSQPVLVKKDVPRPMSLVLSPNGKNLAIVETQPTAWLQLALVEVATGEKTTLAKDLDGAWGRSPLAWRNDNEILMNLVGTTRIPIAKKHSFNADRFLGIFSFDIEAAKWKAIKSKSGRDLKLIGVSGDDQLIWHEMVLDMEVRVESISGRDLPSQSIQFENQPTFMPSWSADGKNLFAGVGSFRFGDYTLPWEIAAFELINERVVAGSGQLLVQWPGEDFFAKMCPKGRWLAVHSHRPIQKDPDYVPWNYYETNSKGRTTDGIWIYDTWTGGEHLLVDMTDHGGEVALFDWSPDGEAIVFENDHGGAWLIYLGDDPTKNRVPLPIELPGLKGSLSGVAWKPGSSTGSPNLAIQESRGEQRFLWLIEGRTTNDGQKFTNFKVDKTEMLRSYGGAGVIGGIDFTKDGRSLIYTSGQGLKGRVAVYRYNIQTKANSIISKDPSYNYYLPQVSPSGKNLAASLVKREHFLCRERL